MEKNEGFITFKRSDLADRFKDVPIEEIGHQHYPGSMNDIFSANIVLFVDGHQKKILKNRHGYEGVVGTEEVNWRK